MPKYPQPVARKPRLTTQQIDYCILHIIRNQELFDYSKQHLKSTDFSPISEMRYALIWAATIAAAERNNNKLPDQGAELIIAMELTSRIDNAFPGELTKEAGDSAIEMLSWIFQFQSSQLNPAYYKPLIQDLIIERTVMDEMSKDLSINQHIGRPVDIVKSLNDYTQKLQTVLLDHSQIGQSAFPKAFKPKKLGKFSTGEKFFDLYMNGGQAPGEVYVLLGPTGLGKTTSGVMIATSTARVWNAAFIQQTIKRRKVSCFFSWEQDLERLRHRFWSFAARIDSSRLEAYADEAVQLSTRGKLEKYELEEYADEIKARGGPDKFEGEAERLEAATEELGTCVRVFDFSGSADNPHLGEGGIDEVASVLRGLQQEEVDIGVVVLDYANAAVRRLISARGENPNNMRHYLAGFCNECRFKIAIPFSCPVWVLNQLNTEANRRAPTAEQHHSYASECGNFAENAWFAFVFSTKDKVNNTCRLYCSKERRAKGDRPPVILKIEGNFCRMRDVSDSYVPDDMTRQYVPRDMANRRITSTREITEQMRNRVEQRRPGTSNMGNY